MYYRIYSDKTAKEAKNHAIKNRRKLNVFTVHFSATIKHAFENRMYLDKIIEK